MANDRWPVGRRRHATADVWMLIGCLILCFGACCPLWAEEPLNVVVTGNWKSDLAEIKPNAPLRPSILWKLPDLLRGWYRHLGAAPLLISVGNHASPDRPIAFLSNGRLELGFEEILQRDFGLAAVALGPGDFAMVRRMGVPGREIAERVWTNVEPPRHGAPGFNNFRVIEFGKRRIGIACLLNPADLMETVVGEGLYQVEDRFRALRRLEIELPELDLMFLVCHLPHAQVAELVDHLDPKTILLWVPSSDEAGMAAQLIPRVDPARVWIIPPGPEALLTAHLEDGIAGMRHVRLHRLPLDKAEGKTPKEFGSLISEVEHRRQTPWRIVTTQDRPGEATFRLGASLHARWARELLRADVALVNPEPAAVLSDRRITPGQLVETLEYRRLRLYEFTGGSLHRFLDSVARFTPVGSIGCDGANLDFLGGQVRELRVGNRPLEQNQTYRVALDEGFFLQPTLRRNLAEGRPIGRRGLSLWDAWQERFFCFPTRAE